MSSGVYNKEKVLEMLKEKDTYGYWKIPIDEYVGANDFTGICLKCGKVIKHKEKVRTILEGKSIACRECSVKEYNENILNGVKEKVKKSPNYGCLKIINIDEEFLSFNDCTVKCTKCGAVHKNFKIGYTRKEWKRCSSCRSVERYLGKRYKTSDNVICECIEVLEDREHFVLKDIKTGNKRTVGLSAMTRGIEKLKFYYDRGSLDDLVGTEFKTKDGVLVRVKDINRRKDDSHLESYVLESIETSEVITRRSLKSVVFYKKDVTPVNIGEEYMTYGGFYVKVLENKSNYCKVLFRDGFYQERNAHFYEGMGVGHPNLNTVKRGKYFNYTLEGIVFRLANPEDVYYKCKKDGSDEYEILRPCDIDEMQKVCE